MTAGQGKEGAGEGRVKPLHVTVQCGSSMEATMELGLAHGEVAV